MDKLIKNAEDIDLSADNINVINNNNSNIIVYHNLDKYHSIESLFGGKECVILLYETKQNFGHWVCLLEFPTYYEFFDSYGFKPDEELNYARYDNVAYLTELLKTINKPLRTNSTRLQTFADDVNTCGRWVSTRTKLAHMELPAFTALFKDNSQPPDYYVSMLTYLYTI